MKKSIKEYMRESSLFEGIMDNGCSERSEMIMEDLAKELDDKKFAKFAKMPTDVLALRAACAKHKGFADLKSRAAAVGMKVTSGFIRYCKYVDKNGKTAKNVLEDVVLIVLKDGSFLGRMWADGSEWFHFYEAPEQNPEMACPSRNELCIFYSDALD